MTSKVLHPASAAPAALDLKRDLGFLLGTSGETERQGFVTEKLQPLLSSGSALSFTTYEDFAAAVGFDCTDPYNSFDECKDYYWDFRNVRAQAERFFADDVSRITAFDKTLFYDFKTGADVTVDHVQAHDTFTFSLDQYLRGTPIHTLPQLTGGLTLAELDPETTIDLAKLPIEEMTYFDAEKARKLLELTHGFSESAVRAILHRYAEHDPEAALDDIAAITARTESLSRSLSDQDVPVAQRFEIVLGFSHLSDEQIVSVLASAQAEGLDATRAAVSLKGLTFEDITRIFEHLKEYPENAYENKDDTKGNEVTNRDLYSRKWEAYKGWIGKKTGSFLGLDGQQKTCPITDTMKDHVPYVDQLLSERPELKPYVTRDLLLAKAAIETEGLSQCTPDGILQFSDTATFRKYIRKYGTPEMKKLTDAQLDKKRTDYRYAFLAAAYYLRDECFDERYNRYASDGVALACFNRRPAKMKSYADAVGASSLSEEDASLRVLPDTTMRHIAKYLVISELIAKDPQVAAFSNA